MILGRVGNTINDDFSVVDAQNVLQANIDSTAFIVHLFDPDGNEVSTTIPVTITNLGYGHYRANFIANSVGLWMLIVYHNTYFPWGKSDDIQVFANDFDSISTLLTRVLGLTQENFAIDDTIYDSNNNLTQSRIRIYNDASNVGSENGVIATYRMTALYDPNNVNNMTAYTMKKL